MTTKIRFTDDTTTVSFDGYSDGKVVRYDIRMPSSYVGDVQRASVDGQEVFAQSYRNVTEEAELYVEGTPTEIAAVIQKLNRLWQRARRSQPEVDRIESPVYIECMTENDSPDWWRSEIVSVGQDLEPSALDMYISQGKVVFTVSFTRKYYWEGYRRSALLYQPGVAKSDQGLTVNTVYDTNPRYDFVDMDNSDIVGDLPAPAEIEMENTYNNADRNANMWVGCGYRYDQPSMSHVIEGENSEMTGTSGANGDCSSGYQWTMTWSGTTESRIGRWALTANYLLGGKGLYFKVLAVLASNVSYTDLYARLSLTIADGLTTIWQGPLIKLPSSGKVLDLSAIKLPPIVLPSGITPYELELCLAVQRATAGSHSLVLDCFKFLPLDGWRYLAQTGYGWAYGVKLVDNAPYRIIYTLWPNAVFNFVQHGPGIAITPVPETTGRHRFIFTWVTATGGFVAARTVKVKIYYRPRRLAI